MVFVEPPLSTQKFEASTVPIHSVTIYSDRAQINRVLSVTLQEGLNEIVLENISKNVDADSVRVDGIAQCATILDVQLKTVQKEDGKAENLAKIKQMTAEIEDLEIKIVLINNLLRILHFQAPLLDKTLSNIEKATLKTVKEEEQFCFDSSTQQSLLNLFAFHEKQSTQLSTKYEQSQLEKKIMASKIEELKQNIGLLERKCFAVKCIFITLHTEVNDSTVNLDLFYNVLGASWRPNYHIRVDTGEQAKLKLYYFGEIRQNTGEDWNNVEVTLSTSKPPLSSSEITLPSLFSIEAQFRPKPKMQFREWDTQPAPRSSLFGGGPSGMPTCTGSAAGGTLFGSTGAGLQRSTSASTASSEPIPTQPLKFEEAFSEQGILSATFTIAKKKTIPSSSLSNEHRVTVTEVKLDDPVLHYDCVPSRNSKDVFLTATGINSTNYPLLEGPASIFTDNCFSSKMKLKTVNSGEKFSVPLGTDPSVQLRYGVCSYRKEGLFQSVIMIYEKHVILKNTKAEESVSVTVFEPIPKSTDQKIKISLDLPLLEKSSEENSLSPALDEDNILKWTEELKPGEEKELLVKWSMEYPVDETIDHNQQEIRHSK